MADGAASVEGSGFLRQRGGDVVSCAGSPVWPELAGQISGRVSMHGCSPATPLAERPSRGQPAVRRAYRTQRR